MKGNPRIPKELAIFIILIVAFASVFSVAVLISNYNKASNKADDAIKFMDDTSGMLSQRLAEGRYPHPSETKAANAENNIQQPGYGPGMYKVGDDLPQGEYVLITNGGAYFEISKDSTGKTSSVLANDNFDNRSIIRVSKGQYLEVQNARIIPVKDASEVKSVDGYLTQGMYKVGKDFPPGEYKVFTNDQGYIEVTKDARHLPRSIIANKIFKGSVYLSVSKGEYLKLYNARIKLK